MFQDPEIVLADSVNYLDESAAGKVVVSSSHGGIYPAFKAAFYRAHGVILNDAGGGLDDAGILSLEYCGRIGMAAAVVSHASARIGDVADMLARGTISHANHIAKEFGCLLGMSCADAAIALKKAPEPQGKPAPYEETRFVIREDLPRVICIDSASLVKMEDADQIVITGSHGGLIGGRPEKAFNVQAKVAIFNDAGVGMDNAGIGRLGPLEKMGIAAAAVAHSSARIGDSRSTYQDGVISHLNAGAEALGASVGQPVKAFVDRLKTNQDY